ncbi:MAG: hypothetical protein A3J27_01410 [Candidatus Tectomicrobia bacterium RIFCSPLOWO2_12_FULL_69_37]|nr:MAG: hypothetical protein A3J27_01410 [Candidatus Tectomicrobia bacterium RIFCSPLOWO2_12_FULL_69_37]OGL63898.1 MAG: hypothetical protein A3I72_13965 [Candidatus Tectomicrobia bacterium RIFCSPLOWO2_02_FULL_70_19]
MTRYATGLLLAGALLLPGGAWAQQTQKKEPPKYIGSETCGKCHIQQHNDWVASGHPYKLRKAEDARRLGLPLPGGYSWDDISYIIGGRNWKLRYMDKQGYIITSTGVMPDAKRDIMSLKDVKRDTPGKNQFNLEDGTWSNYNAGQKNLKYDCGACHTTGYSKEGHQDGLPGIVGTWKETGIGCEGCHGPGGDHVGGKGYKGTIQVRGDKAMCGQCHIRGKAEAIPAGGGFIQHHEQYNELLATKHKALDCVTCHKPHVHAKFKDGLKAQCETCHAKQAADYKGSLMQLGGVKCVDCHMARATKSAVQKAKYEADIRSHLYKINLDPSASMFTPDGKFAKGFLTVEYACLNCHGGRSKDWAIEASKKAIHAYGKK